MVVGTVTFCFFLVNVAYSIVHFYYKFSCWPRKKISNLFIFYKWIILLIKILLLHYAIVGLWKFKVLYNFKILRCKTGAPIQNPGTAFPRFLAFLSILIKLSEEELMDHNRLMPGRSNYQILPFRPKIHPQKFYLGMNRGQT